VPEHQTPHAPEFQEARVGRTWWGESRGLRCGRLAGWIESSGWQWKISSSAAVWLWLNHEGSGLIWGENDRFLLKPGMYAMTGGDEAGVWSCVRHPGEHRLEIVVISRDWLERRLGNQADCLQPGLSKWLKGRGPVAFCGLMGLWERDLGNALARAGQESGPARLMAEARVLEWAAVRLFRSGPNSEAVSLTPYAGEKDPVKRAIQLLSERLDHPLDLAAIAREVGVSPHHLSRKVGAETGATLQRHLRRLRIERACEALDSKRMNVTEVALEVGYQSLSHFAKAFREETGRSPSEWLSGKEPE
jgi:AraC-like DNA-binding protein